MQQARSDELATVVTPPEEVREGGKFHSRAFQIDLGVRWPGGGECSEPRTHRH